MCQGFGDGRQVWHSLCKALHNPRALYLLALQGTPQARRIAVVQPWALYLLALQGTPQARRIAVVQPWAAAFPGRGVDGPAGVQQGRVQGRAVRG
eukprot:scaffold80840_cov21-Tisochrysis_lutea.AAC.2